MPAVLTHKSIMLLARERIEAVRAVLRRKVDTRGASITTLDRQLLAIAEEGVRIISNTPRPHTQLPAIPFAQPSAADPNHYPISKFAVMGSMGPDIPGFAALFAPGQAWVFDTIHKGTPDPDRELVNGQSCDFIMEFWDRVQGRITREVTNASKRTDTLDWMRAFVLGHLCHIAGDVVSHPYINDHQWQQAPHDVSKFHQEIEGEMDALVAQQLFGRATTRSGQDWERWWPPFDKVPSQFFAAWDEAMEEVYQARSRRRIGYGRFEEAHAPLDPPPMDTAFIEDGYHMYRHGILSVGYGYGYWSWWGWLAIPAVSALALPLVLAAMPRAGQLFVKDKAKGSERAWMELATTSLAFGLPTSIVFGALVGSLSTRGVEGRYWLGMVGLIVAAILAAVMFATLGVDELPAGFTWSVLFGLPAGIGVVQLILTLVDGLRDHRGMRAGMTAIFVWPIILLVLSFLFFGSLAGADSDAATAFTSWRFWVAFAVWTLLFVGLWIGLPFIMRNIRIPEKPAGGIVGRRFVRLFDDATLHRDAHLAASHIPAEVYPSGRRKLLKLWWTGSGEMHLRVDRYQLVFSAAADGSNAQIVPAPIAPMTLVQFIAFLGETVKQPGGSATGLLQGEVLYPADPDYELPSGATFSDHGDGEDSPAEHDREATKFKKLGSSTNDTKYILYHAPKAAQAVRFGVQGPVPPERNLGGTPLHQDPATAGYHYIHNPAGGDDLMQYAADFASILCLGATTHLNTGLRDTKGHNVEKIYQVFRNWNLDRRRVNEWRTIVAGGAINEKGANPAGYDERMLGRQGPTNQSAWRAPLLGSRPTPNAAEQAAFAEGEATARRMGWVKLLRQWLEVTDNRRQDPLADTSMRPGLPTNRALGRGMAYLFDLADPTASPP